MANRCARAFNKVKVPKESRGKNYIRVSGGHSILRLLLYDLLIELVRFIDRMEKVYESHVCSLEFCLLKYKKSYVLVQQI